MWNLLTAWQTEIVSVSICNCTSLAIIYKAAELTQICISWLMSLKTASAAIKPKQNTNTLWRQENSLSCILSKHDKWNITNYLISVQYNQSFSGGLKIFTHHFRKFKLLILLPWKLLTNKEAFFWNYLIRQYSDIFSPSHDWPWTPQIEERHFTCFAYLTLHEGLCVSTSALLYVLPLSTLKPYQSCWQQPQPAVE